MNSRARNALYSLLLLAVILVVWRWRKPRPDPITIAGETMATTYRIVYFDEDHRDFKPAIDSLLVLVNKSINTYDPASEISTFNRSSHGVKFNLPYLYPPLKIAEEVFRDSGGAFDPTVMPLVNAWGFGPAAVKAALPDSATIDSLLRVVGFDKVRFNRDSVWKLDPGVQLDFGGIGQGYGADVITDYLKANGIENMLVELGGEGVACGMNLKSGERWSLGILDPASSRSNQFFKAYVGLSDRSFTTAGNYFNYREVNGQKFSHTIDPTTGFPVQRALLSASVFAGDCATADAWDTAFMVMGHEQAIRILEQRSGIDAFLIYSTPGGIATFATKGISPFIEINP